MKLTENDFELDISKSEVTMNLSKKFLELLQKDGYAKDMKPGKGRPSVVELKTNKAKFTIWGNTIIVSFDDDEIKNKAEFVKVINKKLIWLETKKSLVEQKIASSLLSEKNEIWLQENEQPLSQKEFILKIKLEAIEFSSDHCFTLYFNDGLLFGGHQISASINSNFEISNPSI